MKLSITILSCLTATAVAFTPSSFVGKQMVHSVPTSSTVLEMKYKVAVVGGGPSGACAAEIFAQEQNIDTVFFERKMDNAKPCGGAIPLCMIGEFDLPETVVDRKVCLCVCKFAFCFVASDRRRFVLSSLCLTPIYSTHFYRTLLSGSSNESYLTIWCGSIDR